MMLSDFINGLFEALGSIFILMHVRQALKDKAVAGVSIPATIFFFAWGLWNALWYYPQLDQWFSFAGGLLIVAANAWWVYLLLKYRKAKRPADRESEAPCK